jgi:hypothetical protein
MAEKLQKREVFLWHQLFKEGRENVEYDEKSGRPRCQRTDEND